MKKKKFFMLSKLKKYCHAELGSVSSIFSKHAAMFGKLSQLDHIMSLRGELIARSRGNFLRYTKTAAMFGLDARIALAIFGALSVISGAALYGAISKAKIVSTVEDLNQIAKAVDQYVLDTATDIPYNTSTSPSLVASELISSSKNGWRGPYLPYSKNYHYLQHPVHGVLGLDAIPDMDFSYSGGTSTQPCNVVANKGKACYYWVTMSVVDEQLGKDIDKYIDNSDGPSVGLVRYSSTGREAGKVIVYYQVQRMLTQNNL